MDVEQMGLFAEDHLSLRDNLAIVAGVRADHYDVERYDNRADVRSTSDYDAIGGNIGIVFNPTEQTALYAQYAMGSDPVNSFASISEAQQSFHLSDGQQFEVGFKQSFLESRGEWTVSAFDIVKQDLLTTSLIDPTLTEQVGQQSSQGVEASFVLSLGNWQINANGTLLKAQYDNYVTSIDGVATSLAGNVPTNVPEKSANIMLFWQFASDWQFRTVYQYVGKKYANSTNTAAIDGKSVVNIGTTWQASQSTSIDLRIDNLFDEIYPTWGSTTQWMLGSPRSVALSVRMTL
jgi:iron complex outermembrane receptor protein